MVRRLFAAFGLDNDSVGAEVRFLRLCSGEGQDEKVEYIAFLKGQDDRPLPIELNDEELEAEESKKKLETEASLLAAFGLQNGVIPHLQR